MKPIDTGLIEFKIPFSNGDEGTLRFNPNDSEFYAALKHLERDMKEIYGELEASLDKEGVIEKIRDETNVKIKTVFDSLFGSGASAVIFRYASPTSLVKNRYYPYYFLSEFLPDVVKVMNKTNRASAKNAKLMLEHTAPYLSNEA